MTNVLLTGATGFLGKRILFFLGETKNVITLGRSESSQIKCDLSKSIPKLSNIDVVIHCAGKAHVVPTSKVEEQNFFDVNVNGTRNLLLGFEGQQKLPNTLVFISSVSVYGRTSGNLITEDCKLLAEDSYGLSKIQSEILVEEWCLKHNVTCSILRLPLIAGSNPPGNLKDMIKGIRKGYYFNIGGGKARKSIVLADDVAKIIPLLCTVGGIYNLTDGNHPSFTDLSKLISKQLGRPVVKNIPMFIAVLLAKIGDLSNKFPINSSKLKKIISDLTFDDSKARLLLNWNPKSVLDNFRIDE